MQWSLGLFMAALLCSSCHAGPIHFTKQVKGCVQNKMNRVFSNFSGTAQCPQTCAGCISDPMECMSACANKAAACGCSQELPTIANAVDDCCKHVWDPLEKVCMKAVQGLTNTVLGQVKHICKDDTDEVGSLLQTTKSALEEGAVDVILRLHSGQTPNPSTTALFEMAKGAGTKAQSAATYVSHHKMGAACVNMMEGIESEHAKQDKEMPDLHLAAKQIAERSSGFIGRELPGLKDKVHRAMTAAWSEEGPGMDADEVCEVILKQHERL